MRELWNNFVADESGQGLTEYVLIIGLIAIAIIVMIAAFGQQIGTLFTNWTTRLNQPDVTGAGGGGGTT
jgi:pilus assembly protein Flp/PilA